MSNIIPGDLIGSGGTANVYNYGASSVIKLANPDTPDNSIEHEYRIHSLIQGYGLPIPRLLDMVTYEGKKGLIFEKIEGLSMLDAIKHNPFKINSYSRDMAALQNDINSCKIEGLPDYKTEIARSIGEQRYLNAQQNAAIIKKLDELPDGDNLCHADFHVANIIISRGKYWVIDWMDAARGARSADIMRSYMLHKYSTVPQNTMKSFGIYSAGISICRAYIRQVKKITGEDLARIMAWELPVLAARLARFGNDYEKKAIVKRIHKLII